MLIKDIIKVEEWHVKVRTDALLANLINNISLQSRRKLVLAGPF